jgi:hypothetical protein
VCSFVRSFLPFPHSPASQRSPMMTPSSLRNAVEVGILSVFFSSFHSSFLPTFLPAIFLALPSIGCVSSFLLYLFLGYDLPNFLLSLHLALFYTNICYTVLYFAIAYCTSCTIFSHYIAPKYIILYTAS